MCNYFYQASVLLNFTQNFEKMNCIVFRNKEPVVHEEFVAAKMFSKVQVRRVYGLEKGLCVRGHHGVVHPLNGIDATEVGIVYSVYLFSN